MASGDKWKVINSSYLKIRSTPNMSGREVGKLSGGEIIIETSNKNVGGVLWIQHSRGWSATTSGSVTYLQKVSSGGGSSGGGSSGGGSGGGGGGSW